MQRASGERLTARGPAPCAALEPLEQNGSGPSLLSAALENGCEQCFLRFFDVFRGFSRFLESQRAHLTHDYHTPPFFISTDATAYRSCQKCVTLLSPNSPHSHDSARICTPLNHLNLTLFDVFRRLHYFTSSAKENSRLHNFPASATENSRLHNFPSSATES